MKRAFVFDVDGTLTPSRGVMDEKFQNFLFDFATTNQIFLVTGSDKPKTVEQIGNVMFGMCKRVYQCSGNDVWEGSINTYTNEWTLPEKPWKYLENVLNHSKFSPKTGWHFDERPGLLNFSILGRRCTKKQRQDYVDWDTQYQDRRRIAEEFNKYFSNEYGIVATVAGETGLDITQSGSGKAQILSDFTDYDEIIFFGDKTMPGGNDYDIAQELIKSGQTVYAVNDWKDTWRILNGFL